MPTAALVVVAIIASCWWLAGTSLLHTEWQQQLQNAVSAASQGDFVSAQRTLEMVLPKNPHNVDATQLLGVVNFQLGKVPDAIALLDKAVQMDNSRNPSIVANYVEVLRSSGDLQRASDVGHTALKALPEERLAESSGLYYNLGIVENSLGNQLKALEMFTKATHYNPSLVKAWQNLGELLQHQDIGEAERQLKVAVSHHPRDYTLHFMLGTVYQVQNKLTEALDTYQYAEQLGEPNAHVLGNIAATLQSLGRTKQALAYYQRALPLSSRDAGLYNNYGALLGIMGKHEEEEHWLQEALKIQPNLESALVNLAGRYQDDGELTQARELLRRAADPDAALMGTKRTPAILYRIREALMLTPVAQSWAQMVEERAQMVSLLRAILAEADSSNTAEKVEPDSTLDRIHFYVAYHGLNDREIQDLVAQVHLRYLNLEHYNPYIRPALPFPVWVQAVPDTVTPSDSLPTPASHSQTSTAALPSIPGRRARVGFISKFLGVFEPHGMLLDGVMQHLPRDRFEVIALPIADADGKPLAPTVQAASDAVVEVALSHDHALAMLRELRLDILVFADTLSEPMNHFLSRARLAPIQIAFWGNPITSGSPQIDYFVSADIMEHPFRTRMPVAHEPYVEQVVLLEGQGIWYLRPNIEGDLVNSNLKHRVAPAREFSRADFRLQEGWFLYVLPQSTFKIHPRYHLVLRDILHRAPPHAHLVVTGGRRPRWTQIYLTRLQEALGPELSQRLHMVERVSSEQFPALLRIADVILHPFPFDGSKTSADALEAHKPLVTLPAEYLRGRMALAFLRTMGLPELVARSRAEYVDISVRLATDKGFYDSMVGLIAERVDLIWEDMTVPYEWTRLLSGIIGSPAPSYELFLQGTGRDLATEMRRTALRSANAVAFSTQWGSERWLLRDGVAALESMVASAEQQPCIFLDWNCSQLGREVAPSSSIGFSGQASERPPDSQPASPSDKGDPPLRKHSEDPPLAPYLVDDASGAIMVTDADMRVLAELRAQYLHLSNLGDFASALPIAQSLHLYYAHLPLYLVELGLIHIFLGNHGEGLKYCTQASKLGSPASLVYGCIGLAGMYTPDFADETIHAFRTALSLKASEAARVREYVTAHQNDEAVAAMGRVALESAVGVMTSPPFLLPVYALENNLLSSYRVNERHNECVQWVADVNGLPPFLEGATWVLAFAAVQWSESSRPRIGQLEQTLRARGELRIAANTTLWEEVRRVQSAGEHMLTVALECLQGLSDHPAHPEYLHEALNEITRIMLELDAAEDAATALRKRVRADIEHSDESALRATAEAVQMVEGNVLQPGVVLIVQPYLTATSKATDISIAMRRNLQNSNITDIYVLSESHLSFVGFPNTHKIHQMVIGERLTFKRAFAFANEHLTGRTVILANADIFFDATLRRLTGPPAHRPLPTLHAQRTVLALLKWMHQPQDDTISLHVRTDSQDAWVFQPPLTPAALDELDFYMGLPRCDNRLVHVLTAHNYTLLDPAFAVHAIEIDSLNRTQDLYNMEQTVLGAIQSLLLSDQFVF